MTPSGLELPGSLLGAVTGPRTQDIDARWLMAYAAGLGETARAYFDTLRPDGVLVHPLFPVCYEWPLALDVRAAAALPDAIATRGVHATHDLRIHRPVRAGDRLTTRARVTRVEPRPPGAYVLTRFETVDAAGEAVTTTDSGSLYLGVACPATEGAPQPPARRTEDGRAAPSRGETSAPAPGWSAAVPVAASLAHIYTECARIWNPIHTDCAVAQAAGLRTIILHGTATLALAVSRVLRREPRGPGAPLRRIVCRFGAMVEMPSVITVEGLGATETAEGQWIAFRVLTGEGRTAVRDGGVLVAG